MATALRLTTALSCIAACWAFTAPSAPLALRSSKLATCSPRSGAAMKMSIADNFQGAMLFAADAAAPAIAVAADGKIDENAFLLCTSPRQGSV
jgi:hypothetical protein